MKDKRERAWRIWGVDPSFNAKSFNELKKNQGDRCALCRRKTNLVLDHDHTTGKVRGLLCRTCNLFVGLYEVRGIRFFYAIEAYLNKTTKSASFNQERK